MIKNTTHNYSAQELVNLIVLVKRTEGDFDNSKAYPFACGVLMAIIDGTRNGHTTLQKCINENYRHYSKELHWAQENNKKAA